MKASHNIARSIVLTVLSQLPAHLFGVLAGVFIARILGPEGRGAFALFYANENLFRTVFGFTLANSIIFFVANKRIRPERLNTIVTVLVIGSVLVSIVATCVWFNSHYDYLLFPENSGSLHFVLLFLVTIFLSQINTAFTAYFQGLRLFRIVNKVLLLNSIVGLVFFLVAFYLHESNVYKMDLIDVIFLSVIVLMGSTFHWVYYHLKSGIVGYCWDFQLRKDFNSFFKFAGLNHLAKILVFLNHRIILWFIALYLDNWHVGIFSIGIGLAQILNSFSAVLESFLSAENRKNQDKIFSIFSRFQFSVILVVCFLITVVSPYVVPWMYGEEFEASVSVLNIVIVGILLSYQSGTFSSLFLAGDQLRYNVFSSLLGIAITVILAPILITRFSIIGAAYSQLIAYAVVFVFQYAVIGFKTEVDRNLFFITPSDWKFVMQQLRLKKNASNQINE